MERSGESVAGFARRTGIPAHRILWWRRRLGASGASAGQFLPVRVTAVAGAASAIEVVVGGHTVRVPAEFEHEALVRVIRAVEAV